MQRIITPESKVAAASRRKPPPGAAPAPMTKSIVTSPEPLPPPPSFAPALVTHAYLGEGDVAQKLEGPRAPIAAVGHALRAHGLASAQQFEELLALASLAFVEPHRYQIETARRVLRFFRGRALLADEVGLGKTVEALMILREYQLRGMVRRALIIVPPALIGQWVGELSSKAGIAPHHRGRGVQGGSRRVLAGAGRRRRVARHRPDVAPRAAGTGRAVGSRDRRRGAPRQEPHDRELQAGERPEEPLPPPAHRDADRD
jgi:hypothetical protein